MATTPSNYFSRRPHQPTSLHHLVTNKMITIIPASPISHHTIIINTIKCPVFFSDNDNEHLIPNPLDSTPLYKLSHPTTSNSVFAFIDSISNHVGIIIFHSAQRFPSLQNWLTDAETACERLPRRENVLHGDFHFFPKLSFLFLNLWRFSALNTFHYPIRTLFSSSSFSRKWFQSVTNTRVPLITVPISNFSWKTRSTCQFVHKL